MTKSKWQSHYGFTDEEMIKISFGIEDCKGAIIQLTEPRQKLKG
jgi:hypothetical protein